jgi:myosin heavy subunit
MANNTRNVGLKISIDGEKEYKQTIAELNRDNAVLASELKKVQEQYKGNEDSMEALTAKQRIYEEQLATQQRKVEEIRTRYEAWQQKLEEVKNTFGASSTQYLEAQRHVEDYRIKLNNAETAEIKMQHAVEENTKAINEQKKEISEAAKLQQEYTPVLKNLDEQAKALEAEMRALTASFSEDITEQEKAEKTAELLNKQFEVSQSRAKMLGELLQKTSEETGDTSEETLKLRQAYASASEQVSNFEHAVEENTRAIDAQGQALSDSSTQMIGWGDTLNDIGDKLGIRIPQAATDALNGIDAFSVGTVAQMAAVAGGVAAAYKGIEALVDITLEAAEKADALLTRSAQTGIDVETLQGLEYSSNFLDFEGIDQSLVKLTASMDKARDGAEKQAEAFAALGVSVTDTDGQLKNNYDTFLEVIDALGEVENATERDAIANDLFGKSYSELKPLIDAGSKALQGFIDEAKQTGIVLTEDQVKKLGEVDDAYRKSQARVEAFKNELAVEFAPAAKAAMETFSEAVRKGGDALIESGIVSGIGNTVQSILALIDAGAQLVEALPSWLNPLENFTRQFDGLAIAASAAADFVNFIGGVVTFDANRIDQALGRKYEYGRPNNLQQTFDRIAHNAAGDMDWRGGLTWVGEAGPELVRLPQGTQIFSNQESQQLMQQDSQISYTDLSDLKRVLRGIHSELSNIAIDIRDYEAIQRMR